MNEVTIGVGGEDGLAFLDGNNDTLCTVPSATKAAGRRAKLSATSLFPVKEVLRKREELDDLETD